MKFSFLLAASLMVVFAAAPHTQSHDVRLRAAQQKETVEGDLQAAIVMSRQLADDKTTPPEIAAKAMLQVGRCYERLGSAEARKAYERVVAHYPGQSAAVAEAKARLAAIPESGSAIKADRASTRRVIAGLPFIPSSTLTSDGRYAAALRGRSGVELLDLLTGERQPFSAASPVGNPAENVYGVAISPDGKQVIVDVPTGPDSSELRLLNRSTPTVRAVMTSDVAYRLFVLDWSRDGRTVLVNAWGRAGAELHLLDLESGEVRPASLKGERKWRARLLPDTKFLAYSVLPMDEGSGRELTSFGKIYVERIDGSGDQLVADPENGAMLAGWSADGQHVIYVASDRDGDHVWAVRVEDGRATRPPVSMAQGLARGDAHSVTASGSWMLIVRGPAKVYSVSIDPETGAIDGQEEPIAKVNGRVTNAAWSRDGRLVYAVTRDRAPDNGVELFLRDAAGGEDRKLGTFPSIPRRLSWTPDGKALLLPGRTNNGTGSVVIRYWPDDGRTEEVVPARPGEHIAKAVPKLAPNGRTLYYLEGPASMIGGKLVRYDLTAGSATSIATVNHTYDLAPDGEHLAVPHLDPMSKQMIIRIIKPDGQMVRELVRLGPDQRVTSLAWAPDGKWIYFTRALGERYTIDRVPASGGPLVSTGIRVTNPWTDLVVHPSGTRLAFLTAAGSELWSVDGITPAAVREARKH